MKRKSYALEKKPRCTLSKWQASSCVSKTGSALFFLRSRTPPPLQYQVGKKSARTGPAFFGIVKTILDMLDKLNISKILECLYFTK